MRRVVSLLSLSLWILSCSSSEDPSRSSRQALVQEADQCVEAGDLNCAQKKYCELRSSDESDHNSGLHCCVSVFLNAYFSENTRELGKMLGYDPASFSELKKTPLAALLSQRKIPFGELVLLPSAAAPSLKEVFTSYAKNLTSQQASTSLFNQRVLAFGEDLERVEKCLDKIATLHKSKIGALHSQCCDKCGAIGLSAPTAVT
jgi:hypothetical protein